MSPPHPVWFQSGWLGVSIVAEPEWFSEAWETAGVHWHAYASVGDRDEFAVVPLARVQRLELTPDAVLATPDEVGDYIAEWVGSRDGRPTVFAPGDGVWVEVGDAADMERIRGDYALIAARGDSAYVHLALGGGREDLYLEAVIDDCNGHHDDQHDGPGGARDAADAAGAGDS